MTSHASWAAFSAWLWPAMANHLWQSTVFAAIVFGLARGLRNAPAHVRHLLWLVAFGKFAVPAAVVGLALAPLAGGTAAWVGPAGDVQVPPAVAGVTAPMAATFAPAAGADPPAASGHHEAACLLAGVWAAGAVLLLVHWRARMSAFAHTLCTARPAGEREAEILDRVRRRFPRGPAARLVVGPRIASPGVWGVFRPVVLLPEGLPPAVSDDELEALLMHELVHVARRDNLIASLQMAVCCVFWFHPLVWILDRRLLAERELACDEQVVAVRGESRTYASSLLKVVRFCLGWRVVGVSYAARADLRKRIEAMMTRVPDLRMRRPHRLVLLGAMAILLVGSWGAVLLAASREAAHEEFARRGRYLARNLAFNSDYGVLIEDPTQLDDLVRGIVSSSPDVVGVAIEAARGVTLARTGELEAREGVALFRAPVTERSIARYAPRNGLGLAPGALPAETRVGEVRLALRERPRSAREERRVHGQAIADTLAFMAGYGVLIEDTTELRQMVAGVIECEPEVAGVVIRRAKGQVLARSGEAWRSDDSRHGLTENGMRILRFSAPVSARAKGGAAAVGEVEVALRED